MRAENWGSEKDGEEGANRSRRRSKAMKVKRAAKDEKERFEEIAEKMHRKTVERVRGEKEE